MYFEDIYKVIKPYWNERFPLDGIKETQTYVSSIKDNYNEIEHVVDNICSSNFSEWESMLVFTMYQALTAHAIRKWKEEGAEEIFFSDVPITVFEAFFRKNMEPEAESEGNPEYLKKYKGLKNNMA